MHPQNNSKPATDKVDSLHSYAIHLRDANSNLTEQIRRENIKTREIIFTLAAYFGISDLTRQKITEQMKEAGVDFLDEQQEGDVATRKAARERSRAHKQKLQEEIIKMAQPKKKVKNIQNIFEIQMVDRSKIKQRPLPTDAQA